MVPLANDMAERWMNRVLARQLNLQGIAGARQYLQDAVKAAGPRDQFGVHPPESLPVEIRRSILRDAHARGFRVMKRVKSHAPLDL